MRFVSEATANFLVNKIVETRGLKPLAASRKRLLRVVGSDLGAADFA